LLTAKELGIYNIRVNAVAPGVVETDMMSIVSEEMKTGLKRMIPLNRLADPDELAGAYLYLASDLSKYTTGTIINVDGGIVM
jgi:NAD(P)-dependent dehydrogenase (short-subunit alcohol dehydrogenase family)